MRITCWWLCDGQHEELSASPHILSNSSAAFDATSPHRLLLLFLLLLSSCHLPCPKSLAAPKMFCTETQAVWSCTALGSSHTINKYIKKSLFWTGSLDWINELLLVLIFFFTIIRGNDMCKRHYTPWQLWLQRWCLNRSQRIVGNVASGVHRHGRAGAGGCVYPSPGTASPGNSAQSPGPWSTLKVTMCI